MMRPVRDTYAMRAAPALIAGLLAVCLLAPPADAATRIYRTVDEDGNVVFTDVPPRPGEPGEAVELGQSSTFSPPPAAQAPQPSERTMRLEEWLGEDGEESAEDAAVSSYSSLNIVTPADDAGLRDNAGNVTVTAEVSPDLQPGHVLELYLDGQLVQSTRSGSVFQLSNVDRGTHTIEVRVADAAGNPLIRSEPRTFHLQRRSVLLQPARPRS